MDYKIVKGTKPTLASYNKYVAKAVHYNTITAKQLEEEIEHDCSATAAYVILVLDALQAVLMRHLKDGDKVELPSIGTLKLELESRTFDAPEDFCADKHVKRFAVHLVPKCHNGEPEIYKDIKLNRSKI